MPTDLSAFHLGLLTGLAHGLAALDKPWHDFFIYEDGFQPGHAHLALEELNAECAFLDMDITPDEGGFRVRLATSESPTVLPDDWARLPVVR